MTETVRNWRNYKPGIITTPHPSWRAPGWFKKNPWFYDEVVPEFRARMKTALVAMQLELIPREFIHP